MARKRAKAKHRGVRDPYKVLEEKNRKISHKINRKPANEESQEISRKLQAIFDFQGKKPSVEEQEQVKERQKLKKKMKKKLKKGDGYNLIDTARLVQMHKDEPGMKRPLNMIPRLVQFSGESDEDFSKRMSSVSKTIVNESKFEDKFNVDVERDEMGDIKQLKRRKMLDDPLLSDKIRSKLVEREKIRKEKKKERDFKRKHKTPKSQKDDDEFKQFQDKVEFGEVAYEPPSLDTSKLTKMTNGEVKSKSFLFMEKLKGSQAGKMPELTASRKRMLEEERLKAVQAYREMKAAKFNSQNVSLR